jgi:hypothetical protein
MEQDLSNFRPSRLWKILTPERRREAAELFWMDEQGSQQQLEAVATIAQRMKFRTKSVIALPVERKAKYLLQLPNVSESIAARALITYHLARQRPMMEAFLDALGIAHEEGLISDDSMPAPDAEKLKAAAAELGSKFPPQDVALYFSTLVSQDPDTWGGLARLPQSQLSTDGAGT